MWLHNCMGIKHHLLHGKSITCWAFSEKCRWRWPGYQEVHTIKNWPSKWLSSHPSFLCGWMSNLAGLSQSLPVNICTRAHRPGYNQGWPVACRQLHGCLDIYSCSFLLLVGPQSVYSIKCLILKIFFLSRWSIKYLETGTMAFSKVIPQGLCKCNNLNTYFFGKI